jgi:hypothetical protein
MIDSYEWDAHRENVDTEESQKVLDALLDAIVIEGRHSRSVRQWIETALEMPGRVGEISAKEAADILAARGLRVDGGRDGVLHISRSNAAVKGLLEPSGNGGDYGRALARLPGVRKPKKNMRFGLKATKRVSIPLSFIFCEETLDEDRPF